MPKASTILISLVLLPLLSQIAREGSASPSPTLGALRTLVLMAYFRDADEPRLSKRTVDQVVFGNLNEYLKEASYNQASLVGQSTGWLKIPLDTPTAPDYCGDELQAEALKAAVVSLDITRYDYFILVSERICATTSWARISTSLGVMLRPVAWVPNITIQEAAARGGVGTLGHEFGHCLGLGHAGSLKCGEGVPVCRPEAGQRQAYGDPFDVMGYSSSDGHFNAPHKDRLGWFGQSGVLTVTSNGTYTLTSFEVAGRGFKALKIPRGVLFGGYPDYLYVEYRRHPERGRTPLPGGRVLLHILEDPAGTLFLPDATLLVNSGRPFTDPATRAVITVSEQASPDDRANRVLTVTVSGLPGAGGATGGRLSPGNPKERR